MALSSVDSAEFSGVVSARFMGTSRLACHTDVAQRKVN
jgi:hypothetical protein